MVKTTTAPAATTAPTAATPEALAHRSQKRTRALFDGGRGAAAVTTVAPVHELDGVDGDALRLRLAIKFRDEGYERVVKRGGAATLHADRGDALTATTSAGAVATILDELVFAVGDAARANVAAAQVEAPAEVTTGVLPGVSQKADAAKATEGTLVRVAQKQAPPPTAANLSLASFVDSTGARTLIHTQVHQLPKPTWHAPWKLMRVISGHLGWVRAVAVDPSNEWFATGASDRVIKIWDLASGQLKLTLTGHISTVRALAVSSRHPYLFSAGEDKQVKCWDLEYNKVVRQYHGHLSAVYAMALHPTLDVLITGGRDSVARVWDMRTRQQVHVLTGHKETVSTICTQNIDPQVITGSMDSTVRLWDLAAGKTMTQLTHHKKSVRAMCVHPSEQSFVSASADNIKQWKLPEGRFIQNLSGQKSIINTTSVNQDGVMFSGGDNGSMNFWDWKSGYNFQSRDTLLQPGSLDSEAGVFCSTFDMSGTRLLTGEADKTVKIWREDEKATPETHPLQWTPKLKKEQY